MKISDESKLTIACETKGCNSRIEFHGDMRLHTSGDVHFFCKKHFKIDKTKIIKPTSMS